MFHCILVNIYYNPQVPYYTRLTHFHMILSQIKIKIVT